VEDNTSLAAIRNSLFGRLLILLTRYQFNWNYENDVLAMNQYILPWLRTNGGERFFLYLHYIDPHSPYAPPAEYRRMFERDHGFPLHNERKRLVGRDLYDGEIRYTDHGLEQLVEALREVGALDETLFVLTSDHGEEWYEFEAVGHGYSLYQPVVGVPLILHGPGLAPGTVVEEPVQMVDLPATVLELAGLDRQTLGDGRSFAPAARGQEWQPNPFLFLENEFGMGQTVDTDFLHWGVRQGPYKLVRTVESLFRPPGRKYPERELYDLRRDPGEQQNLYDELEHEERVDGLERALDGHLEFLRTRGLLGQDLSGQMGEISPALRAQLEQLGYMVPPAANDGQR
jgi:arylsulfatase